MPMLSRIAIDFALRRRCPTPEPFFRWKTYRCSSGYVTKTFDPTRSLWLVDHIGKHRRVRADNKEEKFVSTILPKAAEAIERVLGFKASDVVEAVSCITEFPRPPGFASLEVDLNKWAKIQRGTDLFIKGCGGFHIDECYERSVSSQRKVLLGAYLDALYARFLRQEFEELHPEKMIPQYIRDVKSELSDSPNLDIAKLVLEGARQGGIKERGLQFGPYPLRKDITELERLRRLHFDSLSVSVVSIASMQLHGYFPEVVSAAKASGNMRLLDHYTELLALEDDCPQRQHFLRHYHYWSKPDNLGSIDEIARAATEWKEKSSTYHWPDDARKMKPSEILKALRDEGYRRKFGPLETYDYLKDLRDGSKIKVLRSNYDILEAAKEMRNCSASYIDEVEMKQAFLAVLQDARGRPIVMGEYRLRGRRDHRKNGFSQILRVCNEIPCKEEVAAFREYDKRFVRPWRLSRRRK